MVALAVVAGVFLALVGSGITGMVTADTNSAPVFNGAAAMTQDAQRSTVAPIVIYDDKPFTLDLNALFSDPDGDALAFIATSADGIDVSVTEGSLTLARQPGSSGERTITVIASDGGKSVSQALAITLPTAPDGVVAAEASIVAPSTTRPSARPTPSLPTTPDPLPITEPEPSPTPEPAPETTPAPGPAPSPEQTSTPETTLVPEPAPETAEPVTEPTVESLVTTPAPAARLETATANASGSASNLTIWDETDSGMPYGGQSKEANVSIRVFANFTNSSGVLLQPSCSALSTQVSCQAQLGCTWTPPAGMVDVNSPCSGGYPSASCSTRCSLAGYTCASIGTDAGGTNGMYYADGIACSLTAGDCGTVMTPFSCVECEGIWSAWTNCNCVAAGGGTCSGAAVNCQIRANDTATTYNMTYNATTKLYEYNRSFLASGSYSYNVSCNRSGIGGITLADFIVVSSNNAPVIQSILLNSTNLLSNDTDQNITFFVSATDIEGDNVTYVGDWYRNGSAFVDQYWNVTMGGTGADEGYGVAVDAAGNVYVTGKTASFGAGSNDFWTIKYGAAGNQLWNKTVGGTGDDTGMGVGVDAAGNVYVGGYTNSFGAGNYDYWIIKYDTNGNQLWNRTRGGTSSDIGADIAVDSAGNTVMTGYSWSFGAGSYDVWTMKYDSSGNQLWNKTTGSTNDDSPRAVALDAAGNIVVAGYTQSYGAGGLDVWTLKYNSSGGQLWNVTWGGSGNEQARGVAVDPAGNVYVAGQTGSFGAGLDDVFMVKYDSGGNQLWNRTAGGAQGDQGWGLVVDQIGNAYVTGYTGSFPPGFNEIWTLKYDTNGNQQWNRTLGGASTDEARAVALDAAGDLILTGRTASFGAGSYDVWAINYKDGFVKANQAAGVPVLASVLESRFTQVGDIWGVCVTPNDGTQDGAESCSNNVTIVEEQSPACSFIAGSQQNVSCSQSTATDSALTFITVNNSVLINVTADSGIIINASINYSWLSFTNVTVGAIVGSRLDPSVLENCTVFGSDVNDSVCLNSQLYNSTLFNSTADRSLSNWSFSFFSMENVSAVINSTLYNSSVYNSTLVNSTIINSTIANTTLVANSSVLNSTVANTTLLNASIANCHLLDNGTIQDRIIDCTVLLTSVIITAPLNGSLLQASAVDVNVSANVDVFSCTLNVTKIVPDLWGDGSDGPLVVSALNTVVNNYTFLVYNVTAGEVVVGVNSSVGFSVGDEVLVIQMQNASADAAGSYEFANISSIDGNNITLASALGRTYYAGRNDNTSAISAQLVKVPNFLNVTVNAGASITAPAWNGYVGGIIAFRSRATVVAGSITASGKGFRLGDRGYICSPSRGQQGESYRGNGTRTTTANGGGGGGAYSNDWGPGGGGAGYGEEGSAGTLSPSYPGAGVVGAAGASYGEADLSRLLLGSGGGGGGAYGYSCSYNNGGLGGAGGGAILIYAESINVTGFIIARGNNGGSPAGVYAGGGGAGSGGSIYLASKDMRIAEGKVNASGGFGSPPVSGNGGTGGNGSVGRVRLDFVNLSGASVPVSGFNGTVPIDVTPISYPMQVNNASGATWANLTLVLSEGNYTFVASCLADAGLTAASGVINASVVLPVLAVWDETDSMPYGGQTRYPDELVRFYANYTNLSGPMQDGSCFFASAAETRDMPFNATVGLYELNRTFATNGTFSWNVTCSGDGRESLFQEDAVTIPRQPAVGTSAILNTTNIERNDTNQNLTLFSTVSYDPSARIYNITTWYRNNATVMALYLPFEGNGRESTNATDYSGNGNNATVYNATWLLSGGRDGFGAYRFNGTSDFIEVPPSSTLNLTKEFTFSVWVYRNSRSGGYERLISKSNSRDPGTTDYSHWLQITPSDLLQIGIVKANGQSAYLLSTANVTPGVWHHVVATKSNLLFKVYIDGVLDSQGVTGGSMGDAENNNFTMEIGRLGDNNIWYYGFNGTMDEVQIWNRSISDAEVRLLYQNRTDQIDYHELAAGDVWAAAVTPNDGEQDFPASWSNNVTIQAANATLVIYDTDDVFMPFSDTPVLLGDRVSFLANFSNVSGRPVNTTDGACRIDVQPYDGYVDMAWDAGRMMFNHTQTFATSGTREYRVQCFDNGDESFDVGQVTVFGIGCGTYQRDVTLTSDIAAGGTCIHINGTGITVDCQNHKISYASTALGYGINATYNKNALVVRNCVIEQTNGDIDNAHAIYFANGNDAILQNNSVNILSHYGAGVYSSSTSNVVIDDNRLFTNNTGIYFGTVNTASITDNRIYINTSQDSHDDPGQVGKGIVITNSHDIDILRNDITKRSIGGYWNSYCGEDAAITMDNTNETLVQHNRMLAFDGPSWRHYAVRLSGYNNKLLDNDINSTGSSYSVGLFLGETYNATIRNNTIRTTGKAILQGDGGDSTYCSTFGTAHNNTIVGNAMVGAYGVYFDCTVSPLSCAIGYAYRTSSNIIANNSINVTGGGYGVNVDYATSTSVRGNTIQCAYDDGYGIASTSRDIGVDVLGNRVKGCEYSIRYDNALGTRTCDNNVIENGTRRGITIGSSALDVFVRNNTVSVGDVFRAVEGIYGYGIIAGNRIFHRGTSSAGIYITNAAIVENNSILFYDTGASGGPNGWRGIDVETSGGPRIRNNDITINRPNVNTQGWSYTIAGVYLGNANAVVDSNNITVMANVSEAGIYLGAGNQTITNNRVRVHQPRQYYATSGYDAYGIYSSQGANIISNNVFNVSGTFDAYGLYMRNSVANTSIENNTILAYANKTAVGLYYYVPSPSAGTNLTNNNIRVWSNVSGYASGMYLAGDDRLDHQRITGGVIDVEGKNSTGLQIYSTGATAADAPRNITIDGVWLQGENATALLVNGTNITISNVVINDTMGYVRLSTPISGRVTNLTLLGPNTTINWPNTFSITTWANLVRTNTTLGVRSARIASGSGGQFNTTAVVTFRDVWLSNPQPIIDRFDNGVKRICRSPDCTNYTFNQTGDNTFTLNVSHFTNYTVMEDTTPPAIELNIPRNGAVVTANAPFIWTATDDLDTNMSCNVTFDSVVIQSMRDSANGQRTNLTHAPFSIPGPHYWNVSCVDGTGNWNASETAIFTVENVPTLDEVIVNSTRPRYNTTDQNLTRYLIGLSDIEGDPIRNITTWYRNGTSTMLLNWPFEANNGDENYSTTDYSGRSLTGTAAGVVAWQPNGGRNGQGAYFFNGSPGWVYSSSPGSVNNSLTVAIWVKQRSVNNQYHRYLGTGPYDTAILRDDSASRWAFYLRIGGAYRAATSTSTIIANRWYFLAGTWDGKNQRFYINGVLEDDNAWTGNLEPSGYWYAGANWAAEAPNGTIDDIMVFNESLSSAQILALYQNRTDFWSSNDTEIGEEWSACVTPNDGIGDGDTTCSNNVTILAGVTNIPPVNISAALNATSVFNTTDDNLTLWLADAADEDGDPARNITTWYRNGASELALYLPFEGNYREDSNATDYSGNGRNGTVLGPGFLFDGGVDGNGAYSFGTNTTILTTFTTTLQRFTAMAWVKPKSRSSGAQTVISKRSYSATANSDFPMDLAVTQNGNGAYCFVDSGNDASPDMVLYSDAFAANTWHHLACAYDGYALRLYVDGTLNKTLAGSITLSSNSRPYSIGRAAWESGTLLQSGFNGTIDDVMLWNRSLSAAQIRSIYQGNRDVIVSDELAVDDVWYACVTPTDGIADGNRTCSNNVTITAGTDSAPVVNSTLLNDGSGAALDNDNITLYVNTSDAEGEQVSNITNWFVNGGPLIIFNLPFDGPSNFTFTRDYSPLGRNASVVGALYLPNGDQNGRGAYQFDGVNDYISGQLYGAYAKNDFTYEFWAKPTSNASVFAEATSGLGCFGGDRRFAIFPSHGGTAAGAGVSVGRNVVQVCEHGDSYLPALLSHTVTLSDWTHIVVTYTAKRPRLYLNGVLVRTGLQSTRTNVSPSTFISYYDSANGFNGTLGEVRIYNRSLTAPQVAALYANLTNVIVSNETSVGDVWRACVIPVDERLAGNASCSDNLTVVSALVPVIGSVRNYSITNESARINWSTDLAANSTVAFGTTQALLDGVSFNVSFALGHDLNLSNLINNTFYYYNVTSCSAAGGCATAGPYNFTTLQNTDTIQPSIVLQQAQNITNQSAVINVTTDEYTNITVYYGETPHLLTSYAYNTTFEVLWLVNLTGLINGTQYYYNITVCDAFLNCNTTGPFTFTTLQNVDNTIPAITLIHPSQGVNVSASWFNFSWLASDNAPTLSCDLMVDSVVAAAALPSPSGVVTNSTIAGIADGVHYWNVSCSDGTNANVSETRAFTADVTPPMLDNMTQDRASPASYSATAPVNLTINVSDAMHGIDTVVLFFDGVRHVPASIGDGRYQVILPPQFAATHNYSWFANDTLGNANATAGSQYVVTPIDLAATGLLNITITPGATVTYGTTTTLTCTAAGDPSGVITLYRNTSSVASGASPQVHSAAEAAGIYNITCAYPATQNFSAAQVDAWLTVERAPVVLNLSLNGTEDSVNIDLGGVINLSANLSATQGDTIRGITVYNNGSSVASGASPQSANVAFTQVGIYNITAVYAGNANHSPQIATRFVNVQDVGAPVITLLSPPDGTNSTTGVFNFTWLSQDDAATFATCNLSIDGVVNATVAAMNGTPINVTVPGILDGVHAWNVRCNDSAGNVGTSFTWTFTVDSLAPFFLISPTADVTNGTARINITASEPINVTLRYGTTPALGAGAVSNASFNANHSILLTGLLNNTLYYYNLSYCDLFGNCNVSGPFSFTTLQNQDLVQPVLLSHPVDLTNQSGRVNTTYNEPSNITINYGLTPALGGAISNASYALGHSTLIPSLLNNTLYYYNVTLCDPFGNCRTNGSFSFTTDNNTAPSTRPYITSIRLNSTNPFANDTDQNLTLRFTAQDDEFDPITNMTAWYVNNTPLARLYYPFVAGTSNASYTRDYAGRNVTASVQNGAVFNATRGYDGRGAYYFDGSNDYLSLEAYDATTQAREVAIDLWFYRQQDTGDFERLVTAENAGLCAYVPYYLHVYGGTDIVQFGVATGGGWVGVTSSGAGTVSLNTWNHVVASYNDATKEIKLFLNGVKYSTTGTGSPYAGAATWVVGRNVGCAGNTYLFRGFIDDVKIYNRALSDEQIRLLMRNDTSVISRNETGVGDQWHACVTPNDGVNDGARACSNTVTIIDVIPPRMLSQQVQNITNQSAIVNLTTDEPTNITIRYGLAPGSLTARAYNASFVGTRRMNLTGLLNNTLYYYNLSVCDVYGNCNTTGPFSFTTLQNTDLIAPVILSRTADATNQSARINLTFSEEANVTINFGTGLTLGIFVRNGTYEFNASLLLSPLQNGTLYRYNVTVCDIFGNCQTSGPFTFTTLQNVDDQPPVLLVRTVDATNQTGRVNTTWSENANLTIRYGLTTAFGSVVRISSRQTQHSTLLSGLQNSTLYYYNLTACDAAGNCVTTGPFTFTTRQNIVFSDINLTLDGLSSGISVTSGDTVNLTARLLVGDGSVRITVGGVTQTTGQSPRSVLYDFDTTGTFNVSAVYDGNENFTAVSVSYLVVVSSGGGGGGGGGPEPPLPPVPPPCVGCECDNSCPPPEPPCTGCECDNSCPPPVPPEPCTTCNPPEEEHPSPPPITQGPAGVACVTKASATSSVRITPISLTAANVQVPEGFVLATAPFQLDCDGPMEFTLDLPDNLTDLRVMLCRGSECSERVETTTSASTLICGNETMGDTITQTRTAKRTSFVMRNLSAVLTDERVIEGPEATLTAADASLTITNLSGRAHAGIGLPQIAVPQPKSAAVSILGAPMQVSVRDASPGTRARISIRLPQNPDIDPSSVVMLRYDASDGWRMVDAVTEGDSLALYADVASFMPGGSAVLALVGSVCVNCRTSKLERAYNPPGARDAVVLVHGLFSDPSTFDVLVAQANATTQPFAIYTFGYPFNQTLADSGVDFADNLERIQASYERISIAAHSAGGLVVQYGLRHAQLSREEDPSVHAALPKVRKVMLVGVPNEGVFSPEFVRIVTSNIITTGTFARFVNADSRIIDDITRPQNIPRLPGVDYVVIAGTRDYGIPFGESIAGFLDGLVSVKSAQTVGGILVDDNCRDFFKLNLTHTELIDDETAVRVIARQLFADIPQATLGRNQYLRVRVDDCDPTATYWVVGRPLPPEAVFVPLNCACGNGVCGEGETSENCPQDCAGASVMCSTVGIGAGLLVALALLAFVLGPLTSAIRYGRLNRMMTAASAALLAAGVLSLAFESTLCLAAPLLTLIVAILLMALALVLGIMAWRAAAGKAPLVEPSIIEEGLRQGGLRFINSQLRLIRGGRERLGRLMRRRERQATKGLAQSQSDIDEIRARLDEIKKRIRKM